MNELKGRAPNLMIPIIRRLLIEFIGKLRSLCNRLNQVIFGVLFFIMVSFVVMFALSIVFARAEITTVPIVSIHTETAGLLFDGAKIEVHIAASKDDLVGVVVRTATYFKIPSKGSLVLLIYDAEANQKIAETSVRSEKIRDNMNVVFNFPVISDSINKNLNLIFHTIDVDQADAITLWTDGISNTHMQTFYNGNILPGNLELSLQYNSKSYRYTWALMLLSSLFGLFSFLASDYGIVRNREVRV